MVIGRTQGLAVEFGRPIGRHRAGHHPLVDRRFLTAGRGVGRGEQYPLHAIEPGGFQDIQRALRIDLQMRPRIADRLANLRFSGHVNHPVLPPHRSADLIGI